MAPAGGVRNQILKRHLRKKTQFPKLHEDWHAANSGKAEGALKKKEKEEKDIHCKLHEAMAIATGLIKAISSPMLVVFFMASRIYLLKSVKK